MAVAFRAGALQGNGLTTATATLTFTVPASIQAGDVAYAMVNTSAATTMTTPASGWTLVGGPVSQAGGTTSWLYRKVLVAADASATASWVVSATSRPSGVMEVYSGVDNTTPEDATPTSATFALSTTFAAAAITTVTTDAAIVNLWFARVGSGTIPTITVPGTHTVRDYSATNFATTGINTSCRGGELTALSGTPGAKGSYSATIGASSTGASWSIALRPALDAPVRHRGPNYRR